MSEKPFFPQDNYFDRWAEQLCRDVGHLAQLDLSKDSQVQKFQKILVKHCEEYQKARRDEVTTCEHSGIQFNREGKVTGFL